MDEARAEGREPGPFTRGTVLDKYRIEALVGTGGSAAVYRATHLLLRVPVAIKMIRPSVLAREPALADRLLEEARYAARIQHPNVVRVHDVACSPWITYVVMEYVEGPSLATALETAGRLPAEDVVGIAIDVALALRAGLEVGLIHRDIKPANILLARTGGARIVDFGLACAATDPEPPSASALLGTRGYMAPEQARDPHRVDFRADVFALGVTLCEALTGAAPSASGDVARDVPALLRPLLRRMIAPSSCDRPSSYDALLSALRHAACALRHT